MSLRIPPLPSLPYGQRLINASHLQAKDHTFYVARAVAYRAIPGGLYVSESSDEEDPGTWIHFGEWVKLAAPPLLEDVRLAFVDKSQTSLRLSGNAPHEGKRVMWFKDFELHRRGQLGDLSAESDWVPIPSEKVEKNWLWDSTEEKWLVGDCTEGWHQAAGPWRGYVLERKPDAFRSYVHRWKNVKTRDASEAFCLQDYGCHTVWGFGSQTSLDCVLTVNDSFLRSITLSSPLETPLYKAPASSLDAWRLRRREKFFQTLGHVYIHRCVPEPCSSNLSLAEYARQAWLPEPLTTPHEPWKSLYLLQKPEKSSLSLLTFDEDVARMLELSEDDFLTACREARPQTRKLWLFINETKILNV